MILGNQPGMGFSGGVRWQWQPTLTAHDPNPPITLENAPPSGGFKVAWARVNTTIQSGGRAA